MNTSSDPSQSAHVAIQELEALARFEGTRFTPYEVPGRLLRHLGNPQNSIPTVHVAGTNGKGSVCALVASMLHAAGSSVGHFASPHLSHIQERCLLNGVPATLDEFNQAVAEVLALAEREGEPLSYFVVGALASFLLFRAHSVDWNVIEVGLGGIFDATNHILAPKATVITSIALDHTHLLGNTLAEIAWNKAGIIKSHVPVFVGAVPPEAEEVIRRQSNALNAPVTMLGKECTFSADEGRVTLLKENLQFSVENNFLQAEYQLHNVALAARVALSLGLTETQIAQGIRDARWPGRVEELSVARDRFTPGSGVQGPAVPVLIDAAHNPEGMKALLAYIAMLIDRRTYRQITFVLSILERKNWQDMLAQVRDFIPKARNKGTEIRVFATKMTHHHALAPESFQELLPTAVLLEPFTVALQEAVQTAIGDSLVVVSGSIYFLGEARPALTDLPFRSMA